MAFKGLRDDPDWGHKPEDDDFKIDSDSLNYMHDTAVSMALHNIPSHLHYERGMKCVECKAYDRSRIEFEDGVANGDHRCSLMLAGLIADGAITSWYSAEYYALKAAEAGLPRGMFMMAYLYGIGKTEKCTEKEARKWLKRAAKAEDPEAIKLRKELRKENLKAIGLNFLVTSTESATDSAFDSIGDKICNFFSPFLKK